MMHDREDMQHSLALAEGYAAMHRRRVADGGDPRWEHHAKEWDKIAAHWRARLAAPAPADDYTAADKLADLAICHQWRHDSGA